MSVRLTTKVWKLALPSAQKMVLLALADHARDDGTGCWPKVASIAAKTGRTERSIQRTLRRLEQVGAIHSVANQVGGRGHSTEYAITPEDVTPPPVKGDATVTLIKEERVTFETGKGDTGVGERVTPVSEKGDTGVTPYKNRHEPSLETSVNPDKRGRGKRAAAGPRLDKLFDAFGDAGLGRPWVEGGNGKAAQILLRHFPPSEIAGCYRDVATGVFSVTKFDRDNLTLSYLLRHDLVNKWQTWEVAGRPDRQEQSNGPTHNGVRGSAGYDPNFDADDLAGLSGGTNYRGSAAPVRPAPGTSP